LSTISPRSPIARNLEKAVENLSQLLEEPIEADTVKDLRKRMMDKTVRRSDPITKPRNRR